MWHTDQQRVPDQDAYRTVREHITELASRSPETAGRRVPSCPEWTVRDLVVHLTGNCLGVTGAAADLDGAGLDAVLATWAESAARLVARTDLNLGRLLMDAFTHELDLCDALDVPVPDSHPAYPSAFEVLVGGLSWSIGARGLPALLVTTDGGRWVAGPGSPAATVTAPRHPLYRSLSGRRTAAQIAELDWTEDPGRWLPAFFWGPFSPPASQQTTT